MENLGYFMFILANCDHEVQEYCDSSVSREAVDDSGDS